MSLETGETNGPGRDEPGPTVRSLIGARHPSVRRLATRRRGPSIGVVGVGGGVGVASSAAWDVGAMAGMAVCLRASASAAAAAAASSVVGRAASVSVGGARRWMRAGGDGEACVEDEGSGARARASSSWESSSWESWGRGAAGVVDDDGDGDGGGGRARFRSARAREKRRLRAYRFAEASEEATREEVRARARRARGRREIRGGYFDGWEVTGERRRGTAAASFASSFGGRGRGRERASDEDARETEDVERAFRAYAWARLRRGGRRSAFGGDFFAADAAFREFFRAERGAGAGIGVGGDDRARAVTAEGFYASAQCEHCETLGLRPNAFVTWDALKTAHREQAVKWHPDRHANDKSSAEIRFKRVYDAYDALIARLPTREARFE